jgi:ppGpp synthetase/RelA/SpoT-type nucleotidyltranferase
MLSNAQADKLGDRLRDGEIDQEALELLNEYRSSFREAYSQVERALTETLECRVTGRPSKSTVAIVEKLKRETIRLTQIQDISGCRILVRTISDQDELARRIVFWLPTSEPEDRRIKPSHGYRALHLIPRVYGRRVEIQIRTQYQHAWAEISEKLADMYGQEVKYGKGPEKVTTFLSSLSGACEEIDGIFDRKNQIIRRSVNVRAAKVPAGKVAKKQIKELNGQLVDAIARANKLLKSFGATSP